MFMGQAMGGRGGGGENPAYRVQVGARVGVGREGERGTAPRCPKLEVRWPLGSHHDVSKASALCNERDRRNRTLAEREGKVAC